MSRFLSCGSATSQLHRLNLARRENVVCFVLYLFSCASQANAAVFEGDWNSPGDGLLTFDDVSQREWLDVPVSIMSQFDGLSLEDRFHDALRQLQPGGTFDGFTLASKDDVIGLAHSAGIDTSTSDFSTNQSATTALLDLLRRTLVLTTGSSTGGLVSDEVAPPPGSCPCQLVAGVGLGTSLSGNVAGVTFFSTADVKTDDGGISILGLFLYREIPEPPSAVLVAFALITLMDGLRT